jgi:hypothetical protein
MLQSVMKSFHDGGMSGPTCYTSGNSPAPNQDAECMSNERTP